MSSRRSKNLPRQVVVLDFDGVVLESADVKTRAFRALFAASPGHLEAIVRYHLANAGISRYVKFQHIYDEILRRPLQDGELDALGRRFSELALGEIMRAPFVPGAVEFLESHAARIPIYVASGTPEDELQSIVKSRGLTRYFRAVYGTPATKPQILRRILAFEGVDAADACFVGDGRSDYEAAAETAVPFIGRVPNGATSNPFSALGVAILPDLTGLPRLLDGR